MNGAPRAAYQGSWAIAIAVVLTMFGWAVSVDAGTPYFVSVLGSDDNDCLTLATACRHIFTALNRAISGDVIIIASGTYTENLTVEKNVTLIGFGQDVTTINGGGYERVMTVTAGVNADVSNLTFTNGVGRFPLWTAGIYVSGTLHLAQSALVATNDIAIRNDGTLNGIRLRIGGNSGGIWNTGTARVGDSSIEANHFGIRNYGDLQLRNSTVVSGTEWAFPGAGIANFGLMTIDYSIVSSNRVTDAPGAGIYNAGVISIGNSLISNNSAWHLPNAGAPESSYFEAWGGGILNDGFPYGTMTITSSVFFGNSASSGGDQIKNGGSAVLVNVTLSGDAGHHGVENGGGMTMTNVTISDMPSGISASALVLASNTIINNTYCTSAMTSLGHNLESGNTCGFTATGDLTNTNPLLGPLQDNGGPTPTYALLPGSPAINAGDTTFCPAADQRGVPRPQAGRCDIGAYELVFPVEVYLPFVAR